VTREPIYAALFAKLAAAANFTTASRRLKHWSETPTADQPALFMAQRSEHANPRPPGLPTVWDLHVDAYVYVTTTDKSIAPGTLLNPLLDALVASIAPDYSGKQTLGGLVQHCWIEGDIKTDEGTLGDLAVAIIPISMKFA
jgi:hypothetical protein